MSKRDPNEPPKTLLKAPAKDEGPRAFTHFVGNLADGEAHQQISYELHELVKHLQEEAVARADASKGSMTIKFSFVCDPKGFVGVGYDIDTKHPKPRRSAGMFWTTPGGNLTPENPKQQRLPLHEVGAEPEAPADPEGTGEVRDV